jgi:hypothetical protein
MKKTTLIFMLVSVLSISIFGQQSTGTISGVVSAPDGVIAGATIVVKDNQTGRERTVTASGEGNFTVSQLDFGVYTVSITANGYKNFVTKDVKVDAARETALNITMEVGGVNEQVTITSAADIINTTNGELSTSISTQQVKELPIDGRNPLSLVSLQAGANATTNSISGQRSSSTTITRDGINVQDNFIRTGVFVSDRPTVDDVSEVTVITQNAGVEQGGGSSVVQLVTPRGGNEFHGSLYAVNRNSAFTANTWSNNFNGVKKPFLNRNQYGGTIGGPVPIFHFGEGGPMFLKNKGFFFFNYEGFKLAQQVSASATTLLPDARTGNFTYVGTDNVTRTVNVLNGTGLNLTGANLTTFNNAGGVLAVDPIIKARLLDKLPTVANGLTTGINYLQTLNFNRSNGAERSNYAGRFDLDINEKNSLNVIYKRTNEENQRADQASGFATTPFVSQGGPTDFFVTSYRITPTNNFSSEFRFGLQFSVPFFNESNVPTDYLISQALVTTPEGSFRAQGRDTKFYSFQNNSVYTMGNHSFRMGGQFEYYDVTSTNLASSTATYTILGSGGNAQSTVLTANLLTGANATDLARANTLRYTLAGIVGGASQTANLISASEGYGFIPSLQTFKYNTISGYISDNWRARPNLSLNLGLRYDYYFPLRTPQTKYLEPVISNPDDITGSLANPNAVLDLVGKNSGVAGEYFHPDKNNFAPSVSFAYTPRFSDGIMSGLTSGDLTIRGGFSVRYINDEYVKAASTLVAANPGLGGVALTAKNNVTGTAELKAALNPSGIYGAVPTFSLPTVRAIPYLISTRNTEGGGGATIFGVDPNLKVQQTYEWNIGIQRSFFFNTVVEARYVGGMSNSAVRTKDFNYIDIINNGFLTDFIKAQNNCRLQGATLLPAGSTTNPITVCTSAAYNPAITGSQQLPVFDKLQGGGFLTNTTYLGNLRTNSPNLLARNYFTAGQRGTVVFTPGTNALFYEILVNEGKYRYNALQLEIRRRLSNGFYFQANYTFSKSLTDILSDVNADQNRQGTFLDNLRPELNYGRADYDRTHAFNANFIYELPFGKGKKFLNSGGVIDAIFGGFQLSSIIQYTSGAPLGVIDPRSSFSARNGRQGAISALSAKELKGLTGLFRTPNGVYFVDPKVLYAVATAPGQPTLNGFDLTQTLPAGYTLQSVRIAAAINTPNLPNQFLFFNQPGQTGNLPVNFINGLPYYNWNASLRKNFHIGETKRIQLSVDAFNVLNSTVISYSADLNIDSTSFSRTTSAFANRVMQFGARFDF